MYDESLSDIKDKNLAQDIEHNNILAAINICRPWYLCIQHQTVYNIVAFAESAIISGIQKFENTRSALAAMGK